MTIKKNLIERECENTELIPLAQNRDQIMAFVNTVMKLGVS